LHSLNLGPPEDALPSVRRSSSNVAVPLLKGKTPSLPLESADPLNALPAEAPDSSVKSFTGALEASYKLLWSKVQLVEPPRTLDDVRRLISRPFAGDEHSETSSIKEKSDHPAANSLGKLIVGSGVEHKSLLDDSARVNIMYMITFLNKANVYSSSGFRSFGASLSRPFASGRTPPPQLQDRNKSQREMQEIPIANEVLTGTQSRQIIPMDTSGTVTPDHSRAKIKRVDSKFLELDAMDFRIGDVEQLIRELRRVVIALDELGGFQDAVQD
jgi:hypothetical protein